MHEIFQFPSCEVWLQDVVCSPWLLKMRKLEKLTRFCQTCCQRIWRCWRNRELWGKEEVGTRRVKIPAGSQLASEESHQNLIPYRIDYIRRGSPPFSLSLWLQQRFKAAVKTKAPLCQAKECVLANRRCKVRIGEICKAEWRSWGSTYGNSVVGGVFPPWRQIHDQTTCHIDGR